MGLLVLQRPPAWPSMTSFPLGGFFLPGIWPDLIWIKGYCLSEAVYCSPYRRPQPLHRLGPPINYFEETPLVSAFYPLIDISVKEHVLLEVLFAQHSLSLRLAFRIPLRSVLGITDGNTAKESSGDQAHEGSSRTVGTESRQS